MPDPKEAPQEPTEPEREAAFAPHKGPAPEQQADGDPGNKQPRTEPAQTPNENSDPTGEGVNRGQGDKGV